MKVSIITVVWNGKNTIKDAIDSVLSQTYEDIEYIIVDAKSTDGTVEIVKSYGTKVTKFLSEPDNGLYDAMNKGIGLATGEIIGILNSDDYYINSHVIKNVVKAFYNNYELDCVFADLVYVHPHNLDKVVRYYDSSKFSPEKFAYGWMPAHPTFFVKKEVYNKYGLFKTDYKIAADYELLVRFLYKHKLHYLYIKQVFITMRTGGISTNGLRSNWVLNKEIIRACSENGLNTNMLKVLSKYPQKLLGLLRS